ncbi:MAG: hypothetical protein WCJ69_07360 [Betaproteobacteria bacterium]
MILRIVLALAALFILASWLERTFVPGAAERRERRRRAWRMAMRQTAFMLAAVAFAGVTTFAAWHALRFSDNAAGLLALVAGPIAIVLAFLAYRTGRR